ncbi:MAG: hypothetical protein AAF555_04020 [Verrucomicrobiota bacterium]
MKAENKTPEMSERLQALLEKSELDDLTILEEYELQEMLAGDTRLRRTYLQFMMSHALLAAGMRARGMPV